MYLVLGSSLSSFVHFLRVEGGQPVRLIWHVVFDVRGMSDRGCAPCACQLLDLSSHTHLNVPVPRTPCNLFATVCKLRWILVMCEKQVRHLLVCSTLSFAMVAFGQIETSPCNGVEDEATCAAIMSCYHPACNATIPVASCEWIDAGGNFLCGGIAAVGPNAGSGLFSGGEPDIRVSD
jgi:hypothetical protein